MRRLYLHAAGLLHPDYYRDHDEDPRVLRALRATAAELRSKAQYAPGDGHSAIVPTADVETTLIDIVKTTRRHVWRELFGEEYQEGDQKRAHAD
jgi:hypothetical protein